MKCIFKFMDVKISLCSPNHIYIEYCKNYFKNYFEYNVNNTENVDMSINIADNFDTVEGYTLEKANPFVILLNQEKRNIIISKIQEKDCLELMRLVRELFIHFIAIKDNCCFFHAACVERNNQSIAIIGEKFAGKTTSCLTLLNQGWNFVSNDKLILQKTDKKSFICWGLPIALGVREGTKMIFENKFDNVCIDSNDNRYYLTPNQIINKFNVSVSNGRRLKLFLFPRFCRDDSEITCKKISNKEAEKLLSDQYVDPFYWDKRRVGSLNCENKSLHIDNDILNIPMYSVNLNSNLNPYLNETIEKILKVEECCNG